MARASTRLGPLGWTLAAFAAAGGASGLVGLSRADREATLAQGRNEELARHLAIAAEERRFLAARLERLEAEVARERAAGHSEQERLRAEVDRHRAELEVLKALDAARTAPQLQALEVRLASLREAAERTEQEAVGRRLDVPRAHRELVEPTVRLNAKSEVGSGSVIYSRRHAGRTRTFVLTAWHIVKDNVVGEGGPSPVELDVYDEQDRTRELKSRVVLHHEALDLALLEVDLDRPLAVVARLPRKSDLDRVTVFAKVYAIGCPLGYAPMPTSGEITSRGKELEGVSYWMTNAPTIFGNSGGGIYLAETRHLIGVLSRISAYKNLIDVAVPHMGIVTPIPLVYDWLDGSEFAFVHKEGVEPEVPTVNASLKGASPR